MSKSNLDKTLEQIRKDNANYLETLIVQNSTLESRLKGELSNTKFDLSTIQTNIHHLQMVLLVVLIPILTILSNFYLNDRLSLFDFLIWSIVVVSIMGFLISLPIITNIQYKRIQYLIRIEKSLLALREIKLFLHIYYAENPLAEQETYIGLKQFQEALFASLFILSFDGMLELHNTILHKIFDRKGTKKNKDHVKKTKSDLKFYLEKYHEYYIQHNSEFLYKQLDFYRKEIDEAMEKMKIESDYQKETSMNFQQFWKKLEIELKDKNNFKTTSQEKKFTAKIQYDEDKESIILITPESQSDRGVTYREFEGVWNNIKSIDKENRFINKDGRLNRYTRKDGMDGKTINLSYIIALIYHIVQNQDMR